MPSRLLAFALALLLPTAAHSDNAEADIYLVTPEGIGEEIGGIDILEGD